MAYTIVNNGVGLGTEYADQRSGGGNFNLLGVYDLEAGSLDVVLTDAADGYVIADTVRDRSSVVEANVFIDASYKGDLVAGAGGQLYRGSRIQHS